MTSQGSLDVLQHFLLQVSSRIQKYFVKLAKAKLPIPGRMPNGITIANAKKVRNVDVFF